MDCTEQQQQRDDDGVMEVPEIDDNLLVELLDASLEEPDEATGRQLGFTADDVDGWVESQELNSIHPHHDCEDCGLDGGVLSDFELDGGGCSRSPSPYVIFDDDDDTVQWTEAAEAALGPMGEWHMDGMAMEWEDDEGEGFSFGPYYGGEAGMEQVYGSPLWE
ncbi:hypothetical protein EJB05_57681, partial [Eragrostis curvula]